MIETKKEILKQESGKIVPIIYDEIFKEVFGNEKEPAPVVLLMSILLQIPYEELEEHVLFLQKSPVGKRIIDKKVDNDIVFLLDLSEPYKINLEANANRSKKNSTTIRNLYWLTNLFGSELRVRDAYTNIRTTIQFNFNTYYVDTAHKDLIEEYMFRRENGWILDERIKSVQMNIAEMKKLWYNGNYREYDEKMQQIICIGALMMITDREDFRKCLLEIRTKEVVRKRVEKIVEDMNNQVELITRYYDREEEEKRIWELEMNLREKKGFKEGIEQGTAKERYSIISKMIENKMTISEISKIIGIREEEVQKIIKEQSAKLN